MRIQINRSHSVKGTVLVVALCTCSILGILMGSYLSLIRSEHYSGGRAQAWNRVLNVAEGGVEEAMAHLNSGVSIDVLDVNSWVNLGGGVFKKQSVLGDAYADVKIITTNPSNPVIISRGLAPAPISTEKISRTIQVRTRPKTIGGVSGAMIVTSGVDFSGFNVTTDSFDSSDPNYSTDGRYDPLKAKDNGDVATTSASEEALGIGNAKIQGKLRTGGGQAKVGAQGSVGDKAFVEGGTNGVQEGHFSADMSGVFPNPELPDLSWLPPVLTTKGKTSKYELKGAPYAYVLDTLEESINVTEPNTILYVTTDIKISSKDAITIADGASLTIYMAGPTASISGKGVVNQTGQAANFIYYGLASNTSLDIGSNVDFVGTVYAPQAEFTLGGGGSNFYDFVGKSITKSVKMNGNFHFHYDESMSVGQRVIGYAAMSWEEL